MLFLIGAAFAMRAGRGRNRLATRTFACAAAAQALVGIALPVLAYVHYPAWMWGYYVDPERVSAWVVTGIFILYWAPFLAGYLFSSWPAIAAGVASQAALLAWQWPRYGTVTTLEGFRAGVRVPPMEVPLLQYGPPIAIALGVILWWWGRPLDSTRGKPEDAGGRTGSA